MYVDRCGNIGVYYLPLLYTQL